MPTSAHGPVPRARIDPIVSGDQALAVFRLAMSHPLCAETLVMFVDHNGCGHDLVSVSGTIEPSHVIDVAETMAMCASVGTDIRGLIMATVRPGGGLVEGDDELWLEAADAVQQTGLVLIEWFVIGRGGVHSPRELLGVPAQWTA